MSKWDKLIAKILQGNSDLTLLSMIFAVFFTGWGSTKEPAVAITYSGNMA
jgi:hypothetical protein